MHIKYQKPRVYKTHTVSSETGDYTRISRTHTVDILKNRDLTVPRAAIIHPQGILDLIKLGKTATIVALYLTTWLQEREQESIVIISQEYVAKSCDISLRSVNTALQLLEKEAFITPLGKQKYKLSAKLAWFGYQTDWAVALNKLDKE